MKTQQLLRKFRHARMLENDCYVADYTECTGSRTGVVLSEEPFEDIAAFQLKRGKHRVRYVAVNLEQHPAFIKGIENCECFFASATPCKRPWMLFLELKYCKAHNIGSHTSKAISQMASVLRKLLEEEVIDAEDYRIYFNYASPANRRRQPFTHFIQTPATALDLIEQYNAYFLGFNQLIIASPQFIRSAKMRL